VIEPLRAIVGPTAAGKSAVAIPIAEALDAEIVCCDSMTVYRGMDIGTAKPGAADRARVPHHVLDVAEPGETFTVARFQALANVAVEHIRARGKHPMLVGGSGLYFQAVVDHLTFPPTDGEVRARLEAQPLDALVPRLQERDPVAAGAMNLKNKRRIVRALEVIEITGEPFSSFREDWDRRTDPTWAAVHPVRVAGLDASDEELRRRIRARARKMVHLGLPDEVRELVARGFRDALTASQAVGYAQAIEVLEDRADEAHFVDKTTRATMRLVKRQRAWFRRDPRIRWFDAEVADVRVQIQAYLTG
jgi:tRNA dimethylallyltransferase